MITEIICAATGAGIGALVGAALSTTELGKKMDENMNESWEKYGKDIAEKLLPLVTTDTKEVLVK